MNHRTETVIVRAVAALAFWTLAANGVVAAGGNFYVLLAAGPAAVVVGLALIRLRPAPGPPCSVAIPSPPVRDVACGIAAATAAVIALLVFGSQQAFWWLALATLGIGILASRPLDPSEHRATPPRVPEARTERALWLLVLACAVLAAVLHKPDLATTAYVAIKHVA